MKNDVRLIVNSITGSAELRVKGSLYQQRLQKRVYAVLDIARPFIDRVPSKAEWRLAVDCDGSKVTDSYTLTLTGVRDETGLRAALKA